MRHKSTPNSGDFYFYSLSINSLTLKFCGLVPSFYLGDVLIMVNSLEYESKQVQHYVASILWELRTNTKPANTLLSLFLILIFKNS